MKVTKIVLALSAVFTAQAAFATDITTTPNAVTTDNIMYVVGATAQTPGFGAALKSLCNSTSSSKTFITLTDGSATPVAVGWKCDTASAATFPKLTGVTGPWIVLKSESSSGDATKTMRQATSTTHINPTSCTLGTAAAGLQTGTCTIDPTTHTAYLGLADVSQKIFAAKGQLASLTSASNTYNEYSTGAGQGFGIVVSPLLYTALQADQGLSGSQIPSIGKSQYASLISQAAGAWATLLPNTPTAHPLIQARRSLSSGTQASSELFFLDNPCKTGTTLGGSLSALVGSSAGVDYDALGNHYTVIQEAAASNVLAAVASTTDYAFGVVSLENAQPSAANTWKYVAIDGVFPWNPTGTAATDTYQKTNVVNGKYSFAYETYLTMATRSNIGSAAVINNIVDFKNALVGGGTVTTPYMGVGSDLSTSYGLYGDPLSAAADLGVDTNHYSRSGNECSTAQEQF